MAVLMTPPYMQFYDNNGDPLSGGKIYTYDAGTTTPKATYTDSTEATPSANPVILDSAGRAEIWINGSYKFVVKDSSDNTIRTVDNVTSFSTSATNINSILPDQTGNSGKALTTDGSAASWGYVSPPTSAFSDQVIGGLTVSQNGSDATNDIDVAAGTCISSDGTTVMTLGSAITKRLDAAWAVGTNQGGIDTGSASDTTYYIWVIHRTDTSVTDVLLSTSSSAPTMPTNYTKKKLIGKFVRASSANSAPYQTVGINKINRGPVKTASGSLTTLEHVGLPSGITSITIPLDAISLSGTDNLLVQIGDSGGYETSGYVGHGGVMAGSSVLFSNPTTSFLISVSSAARIFGGNIFLNLVDASTFTWACFLHLGAGTNSEGYIYSGTKSLSDTLDRVRLISAGTNTIDSGGKMGIIYQ